MLQCNIQARIRLTSKNPFPRWHALVLKNTSPPSPAWQRREQPSPSTHLARAGAHPNVARMDIAPANPEPNETTVRYDRERIRYAITSAALLVAGIWLVWLGGWLLGWSMNDLGVAPRTLKGLVGIVFAPLAHASFEHLVSNTLPLAVLATLTLYAYPRAAQLALPTIWLLAGLGVWLFARSSVHVGISGITHGLMFFLFLTGLLRRDRLGIAISLVVFFFYGGMLLTVLPREQHVSFEYHLAGAVVGIAAAIGLFRLDPKPARKRYSWDDEDDDIEAIDAELEMPRPAQVPVLWQGPTRTDATGTVIPFRPRDPGHD